MVAKFGLHNPNACPQIVRQASCRVSRVYDLLCLLLSVEHSDKVGLGVVVEVGLSFVDQEDRPTLEPWPSAHWRVRASA